MTWTVSRFAPPTPDQLRAHLHSAPITWQSSILLLPLSLTIDFYLFFSFHFSACARISQSFVGQLCPSWNCTVPGDTLCVPISTTAPAEVCVQTGAHSCLFSTCCYASDLWEAQATSWGRRGKGKGRLDKPQAGQKTRLSPSCGADTVLTLYRPSVHSPTSYVLLFPSLQVGKLNQRC